MKPQNYTFEREKKSNQKKMASCDVIDVVFPMIISYLTCALLIGQHDCLGQVLVGDAWQRDGQWHCTAWVDLQLRGPLDLCLALQLS